jgi:hypothetical protein
MGNSLADQLLSVGLATPAQHQRATSEKTFREQAVSAMQRSQLTSKHDRPINLDRILTCETIAEFKTTARILLLEHPEFIGDVVKAAHRFKETDGGRKLVYIVLNVRNLLPTIAPDVRERFLNRAFRRHGSTLETPVEE